MQDARDVHQSAIVIDAVCPLLKDPTHLELYRRAAARPWRRRWAASRARRERCARWGAGCSSSARPTTCCWCAPPPMSSAPSRAASSASCRTSRAPSRSRTHSISSTPIKELGVGIIQFSYNVKNRVGDGCEERTDAGLSRFGLKLIERMNRARVIVDCSHTGYRTTMEAIEASTRPVVFSHANRAPCIPRRATSLTTRSWRWRKPAGWSARSATRPSSRPRRGRRSTSSSRISTTW